MSDPKANVRRQFGQQAKAYAHSAEHAGDVDLSMLIERLHLTRVDRVLDIATGNGFTALAMQPLVHRVVGLDLTWEMLAEGRRLALPHATIDWLQGDVEVLPFQDHTFSVVTCRRSAHHFSDLDRALDEMTRVLRRGGRLGIADQVASEGEAGRRLMEEIEHIRDASHVRVLTPTEWETTAAAHGIAVQVADLTEPRVVLLEEWLDRAGVDAARRKTIEAVLAQASAAAQEEIGYHAGANPTFLRRWLVLIGKR